MGMSAELVLQSYMTVTKMGESLNLASSLTHDTIAWEHNGDKFVYIYVYKNAGSKELQEIINSTKDAPLIILSDKSLGVDHKNVLNISLKQLKSIVSELQLYTYEEMKILIKCLFGKLEYKKIHSLLAMLNKRGINKNTEDLPIEKKEQITDNNTSKKTADNKKSAPNIPKSVQLATISSIEAKLGIKLSKGKNKYYYGEEDTCVLVTFSKTYRHKKNDRFWYSLHKKHREELEQHKNSYIVYGCYQENFAFFIPLQTMCDLLGNFRTTTNDRAYYWHIEIFKEQNKTFFKLQNGKSFSLDNFKMDFITPANITREDSLKTNLETKSNKIVLSQGIHEVIIKK